MEFRAREQDVPCLKATKSYDAVVAGQFLGFRVPLNPKHYTLNSQTPNPKPSG